ncbi:hypothetical protein [Streptosporangium vulgare]|uniref:Head-to-tail adaptor n=1 Tax=Streptosporangium vulgare TaxID=46190 RepID=A0ABV5TQ14_9ACTN
MASLATLPDAVRLGYTLPAGEEEALLARASARIRRAAGQQISSMTSTVRVRVEDGTAILPGAPITAVTTVTRLAEDGGAAVTGWWWDGRERVHGINVSTSGSLYPHRRWPVDVNITLTHGLVTLPDELVELVCSVAVRLGATADAAGMEAGIRSESIDDYSVTYASDALTTAANLLPGEESALRQILGAPPSAYVVRPR